MILNDDVQYEILDKLYVVAENQMGGWCACSVVDGDLIVYTELNKEEAKKEAMYVIEELNDMYDWDSNPMDLKPGQVDYDEDSWDAKPLSEVSLGDNVNRIRLEKLDRGYPYFLHQDQGIFHVTEWVKLFPRQKTDKRFD
jgi:hypothetical protein